MHVNDSKQGPRRTKTQTIQGEQQRMTVAETAPLEASVQCQPTSGHSTFVVGRSEETRFGGMDGTMQRWRDNSCKRQQRRYVHTVRMGTKRRKRNQ
jgi:hypothetical protein